MPILSEIYPNLKQLHLLPKISLLGIPFIPSEHKHHLPTHSAPKAWYDTSQMILFLKRRKLVQIFMTTETTQQSKNEFFSLKQTYVLFIEILWIYSKFNIFFCTPRWFTHHSMATINSDALICCKYTYIRNRINVNLM